MVTIYANYILRHILHKSINRLNIRYRFSWGNSAVGNIYKWIDNLHPIADFYLCDGVLFFF